MTLPAFDVRARNSGEPGPDDDAWLVVCRTCGWHCETKQGYCWSGCPECNAELWLVFPFDPVTNPGGCIVRATDWTTRAAPKRRRNHWLGRRRGKTHRLTPV